jgi:mannose-6-phosphate isomerase-like protein (cupin superfamily)
MEAAGTDATVRLNLLCCRFILKDKTMMMKQKWSDVSEETISEEGIRGLHVPEEIYTFTPETYPVTQSFTVKAGNDFVLYVLNGACKTTLDGNVLQLSAGEFFFFGKGAYQFKSVGKDDVRLMRVSART